MARRHRTYRWFLDLVREIAPGLPLHLQELAARNIDSKPRRISVVTAPAIGRQRHHQHGLTTEYCRRYLLVVLENEALLLRADEAPVLVEGETISAACLSLEGQVPAEWILRLRRNWEAIQRAERHSVARALPEVLVMRFGLGAAVTDDLDEFERCGKLIDLARGRRHG